MARRPGPDTSGVGGAGLLGAGGQLDGSSGGIHLCARRAELGEVLTAGVHLCGAVSLGEQELAVVQLGAQLLDGLAAHHVARHVVEHAVLGDQILGAILRTTADGTAI